jgi:hypothetical protein
VFLAEAGSEAGAELLAEVEAREPVLEQSKAGEQALREPPPA